MRQMTNINVWCDCCDKTSFKMNKFYDDRTNSDKIKY